MPSYPLTIPPYGLKTSEFGLRRSVGISVSPYTGGQQVYKNQLALWYAVFSLPPMNRSTASIWQAFFAELNGRYGTFLAGDPDAKTILGNTSATILVNGDHSIGDTSIDLDGFELSTDNVFKKGDYIQFGSGASSKLYMVVQDADSNASGQSTVTIEPPLKTALSDNDSVTYTDTVCVFRLDTNDITWNVNHTGVYTMSFSCTEAL